MRTLLVVLLMTCVSVCHANPSQQNESKVVRKAPHSTQKTIIVSQGTPHVTHKTVIIKEVPAPSTQKTLIVKKKVKKRKVCKRYYQNGRTYCEEKIVPQRVEVRRVYDEDDVDITYVEPRSRTRNVVVAPARVGYLVQPIGFNLHFRLP